MNIIQERYEIEKEINSGAFGRIYKGRDQKKGEPVAIKIELPGSPSSLKYEVKILTYLFTNKVRNNIPAILWYGIYSNVPCLIMTYYEYSLYDYLYHMSHTIPMRLANHWMNQIIGILENLHKVFLLHRDIKPQNIMIKSGDIHLIDFGLATFYIDEKREHIPDISDKDRENQSSESIIGSPKFASIRLHEGHRCSRRDDLISTAYIYVYMLLNGITPWFSQNGQIKENKQIDNFMTFLSKDIIWTQFLYYLDYVYQLSYDELPNYDAMKQLFI